MTNLLTSWRVIMNILKQWRTLCHHNMFLTSWRTFWCHSELFDVMICFDIMTNLLKSWRLFDVITIFFDVMQCFWLHDKNVVIFLTFSRHDVFLTSWQTLWHHNKRFDITTPIWRHDEPFNHDVCWHHHDVCWHHDELYNIMTCLWHDKFWIWQSFGAMTYVTLIDVMTNVLTSWNFLTTWHTSWRLDALFDVMSWCVFMFCWHDVILTPWPAFCK